MSRESRTNAGSRLGSAVSWTLKTIIQLILAAFLLIVLAALIQFGLAQVERRIDNVNRRIDLLFSDVDNLMTADGQQDQELSALSEAIQGGQAREDELAADLARQDEMLATLEEKAAVALVAGSTVSQSIAALGSGLVALQSDLAGESGRIDQLGGQLDELQAGSQSLTRRVDEAAAMAAEPDEAVIRLGEALRLFRLWELIARARLRLAEDNLGLAAGDVELAILAFEQIPAKPDAAETAAGERNLDARLALALDSLPDDPDAAAGDLDAAWSIVDLMLADVLGLEPPVSPAEAEGAATESTPSPTPEGTLTPQGTPAPGSTPAAGTPQPTPTATPGSG